MKSNLCVKGTIQKVLCLRHGSGNRNPWIIVCGIRHGVTSPPRTSKRLQIVDIAGLGPHKEGKYQFIKCISSPPVFISILWTLPRRLRIASLLIMFQKLRGSALIWAITLSSGSCYVLFGYDQGVLGGLVSQPSFLNAIGNPNPSYLGTIIALYNLGCLAGCMIAAIWGNVLGRRKTILYGCCIMVVGAIVQTATYGAGQLIAGRLISGLGNGMNTATIPVYVSETARSHRRGQMVAVQLSIVIGGSMFSIVPASYRY